VIAVALSPLGSLARCAAQVERAELTQQLAALRSREEQ
jgi:hypothetical protein